MEPSVDIITELAELAFASRLKRLSDRLLKDVSQVYRELDVDVKARWFSILFALHRQSPMTVTALAQTLRFTHTAINQLSKEMIKKNLVYSTKGIKDERQRFLHISEKGRMTVEKLIPIWDEIRIATKDLIDSTGYDILAALTEIERQLDEQDMVERIWRRLEGRPPGKIKILEYRPAFKKHFESLNREWLEEYFTVEKEDIKLLSDPNGKIIRKGGTILFACFNETVVGTAALIRHRNAIFEMAKMAVTSKSRGLGIGKALTRAIIERAAALGATELYLQTSLDLKVANHIYKKFNFKKIKTSPFKSERYARSTITMRLDLKNVK